MRGISRTLRRAVLLSLTLLCATAARRAPTTSRPRTACRSTWTRSGARTAASYDPGPGATTTQVNGALLLVHSVAALHGHDGPARNDQRARLIARFLTGPRVWTDRPLPGAEPEIRGPGWRAAPDFPSQHPVFEVEAAEGLASAYLARDVLGLDAATVEAIRSQIARVATGPDFAWPALRLNQHNWNSSILAAHATVNGRDDVLADGLRRHLARFTGAAADNFGGGLRFRYLPHRPPDASVNLDSAEYANIVLGFSRHYGQARRAGMPAPARLGLLRDWVRRAIAGYWTHAGYLNWDTGLGFHRWHQRKKVPLAQLALLGIATEPGLQPTPEWGAWARWLFDRGLEHYTALVERDGRIPHSLAFGVNVFPQSRGTAYLTTARYAANAMRALQARPAGPPVGAAAAAVRLRPGHGTARDHHARVQHRDRGGQPGRVPVRRARPRAPLRRAAGGRGEHRRGGAGGVRAVGAGGRTLLETQYGRRSGASALRLSGPARRAASARRRGPVRAAAGERVDGRARTAGGERVPVPRGRDRGPLDGQRAARAGRRARASGSRAGAGPRGWSPSCATAASCASDRPLALARIARLHVISERSGYVVTPRTRPRGAIVRRLRTRRQGSAPDPGPTLEVSFKGRGELRGDDRGLGRGEVAAAQERVLARVVSGASATPPA